MSQPTESIPVPPPVCVTLCLPTVKSGGTFRVAGASNNPYEFKRHTGHGMLVREYTSLETFYREELDLRRKIASPYVITTLLGVTHPVAQAKEAVATLIAANLKVDISARKAALLEIIGAAEAAILEMEQAPEEEAPATVTPPAGTPVSAVALRTARWKGEDGKPLPESKLSTEDGALTQPLPAGGLHTQMELMKAEWPSVQALAKELGIALTHATPKSGIKGREQLVNEILAKEAAK